MAGILFFLHRDGAPVPRETFDRLFAHLDHRGPDGRDVLRLEDAALGHQHFFTTPEEAGERQPLSNDAGDLHLAFDGRLDNREELRVELDLPAGTSDAALALAAYRRWREGCLERFLGPFAMVVLDRARRRVVCGRDALGGRTLFYTLTPRLFLAASEETALLAHPEVPGDLDETTLTRFFAAEAPRPGCSFFTAVRELPPAHGLTLEGEDLRTWRYWEPDLSRQHDLGDAEVAERLRELLTAAVACRLRAPGRPALLTSGGLDSTSIAAAACRAVEASGKPLAVSWVFGELAACDERRFIHPLVRRLGLDAVEVPGDGAWPLSGSGPWPLSPNSPTSNPYRRLLDAAYGAARERGARAVLNGWGGDHLWAGAEGWLAALLRRGRLPTAALELSGHLFSGGDRLPLRRVVAAALRRRRAEAPAPPPWLTPAAAARLGPLPPPPGRAAALAGIHVWNAAAESFHAHRAGVEVRSPWRDRRLVELMLALPAHHLYRRGRLKYALREAMKGLLPEEVRRRRGGTLLTPLFERGLRERERHQVLTLLGSPGGLWRNHVEEGWLRRTLDREGREPLAGSEAVVLWQCVAAELWHAALPRDVHGV